MKSAMAYAWGTRGAPPNTRDRMGERHGSVRLVKKGADGAWWGKCDGCQSEKLFTKSMFRCGTVRCCTLQITQEETDATPNS